MAQNNSTSNFFQYLLKETDSNGSEKIPSLQELSKELNISVSTLREQLEVAKALGFVEVRPRTGIRRLQYSFSPAVVRSLSYAIGLDDQNFRFFAELRNHIEEAYWHQAVRRLDAQDHEYLKILIGKAFDKLNGNPVQIPHVEHRQLHMKLYEHLENPFVLGILEAFWEAYEAVGLSMFADYDYLQQVWEYHRSMVEALCVGDYDSGYLALVSHKDLLFHHRVTTLRDQGEVENTIKNTM
jgi:DNA-binding FadR family transcriptional regulator